MVKKDVTLKYQPKPKERYNKYVEAFKFSFVLVVALLVVGFVNAIGNFDSGKASAEPNADIHSSLTATIASETKIEDKSEPKADETDNTSSTDTEPDAIVQYVEVEDENYAVDESTQYIYELTDNYEPAVETYSYNEFDYPEYYESVYDLDLYSAGVIYDEQGTRYTWYSENVLPGGGLNELNNNGRHVDDQGYIRDGDGYLAVASNDYPQGTIIDTPFGEAKVYDNGCDSGTVDMYVSW